MTLNFNLSGADRKPLVKAVSQILDIPAVYLKVPTCAYQVGEYNISKDGALAGPDNRQLVAALEEQGFSPASSEYDAAEVNEPEAFAEIEIPAVETESPYHAEPIPQKSEEPVSGTVGEWKVWSQVLGDVRQYIVGRIKDTTQVQHGGNMEYVDMRYTEDRDYCERLASELNGKAAPAADCDATGDTINLTVEMPLDGFTPDKMENLIKMVSAKENLIKAALGVDALPIQQKEDRVSFPWFEPETASEEVAVRRTERSGARKDQPFVFSKYHSPPPLSPIRLLRLRTHQP